MSIIWILETFMYLHAGEWQHLRFHPAYLHGWKFRFYNSYKNDKMCYAHFFNTGEILKSIQRAYSSHSRDLCLLYIDLRLVQRVYCETMGPFLTIKSAFNLRPWTETAHWRKICHSSVSQPAAGALFFYTLIIYFLMALTLLMSVLWDVCLCVDIFGAGFWGTKYETLAIYF